MLALHWHRLRANLLLENCSPENVSHNKICWPCIPCVFCVSPLKSLNEQLCLRFSLFISLSRLVCPFHFEFYWSVHRMCETIMKFNYFGCRTNCLFERKFAHFFQKKRPHCRKPILTVN